MKTNKADHPKPWTHEGGDCLYHNGVFSVKTLGSFTLRENVLSALNACSGIVDPQEAIKQAREALEAEEAWRNAGEDSGELRSLAGNKRRKALELLTPKP